MTSIFDPLVTKNFSLRSRLVRSATAERIAMAAESDGRLLGSGYALLAREDVGLIVSGHVAVHPSGRLYPLMASLSDDTNAAAWRRAISLTHEAEGKLFIQLNHGGGRCRTKDGKGGYCVSCLPERSSDPMMGIELNSEMISELARAFSAAAARARDYGADGVQLHAAHGYLASQFLSPLTNRRSDEWGGPLENRARFLRLVVRLVREAVGADFPLGIKLGASDDDPAGLTVEDSLQTVKWVQNEIDFVEISGAFRSDIARRKARPGVNEGYYLPVAARFKRELNIPVFVVGGFRGLAKMNEALSSGACDAVAMSRPLIRQPDLLRILRAGGQSECRGCNLCLLKNDGPTACHARRMLR